MHFQKVSDELRDYFSNNNLNTCFTCGTYAGGVLEVILRFYNDNG